MRRSWLYPRLAWQGMVKNRALYLPYLLMSALMVAVYYIMVYLCTPQVVAAMGAGETVGTVLAMGLGVVGVFSAIFLYYCNTFLVGRRMKEYGLYNVLGMGKRNIACIMLFETLLTLLLSLAGGLLAGVSLARAAELLMLRLLNARLATGLFIRWDGILRAAEGFGVIYLIILVINLLRMRLSNPVALLRAESAGERPPRANWLIALPGAAMLGAAYYLAVTVDSPSNALFLFFIAVLLVMGGTFLLFIAGSVTLCRVLQKNKRYYYQTHRFISLSAMAFRMKRNGAGLAAICILCTMVLVMVSSTLCLYAGTEDLLDRIYPRDITVQLGVEDGADFAADELAQSLLDRAAELGAPAENPLRMDAVTAKCLVKDGAVRAAEDMVSTTMLYIYPLSLYEEISGETVSLNKSELLYYPLKSAFRGKTLSFFGSEPYAVRRAAALPPVFEAPCNLMTNDCLLLFVQDWEAFRAELRAGGGAFENSLYLYFDAPAAGEALVSLTDELRGMVRDFTNALPQHADASRRVESRRSSREDFRNLYGSLFFIGLLLGGVFSLAAALLIYYKQISEGYEDARRFAMMRKVGLTDGEIHLSINSQVRTVFFAPLLMAGVHVLFAMPMVRLLLTAFGMNNTPLFYTVTGGCFGAFALIYAAVYLAASRTYYRIVK